MFEILHKETFAAETYLMDVYAPRIAHSALPGQFLIIKMEENSERIPLTISDYHRVRGTVTIVFKAIGESTKKMAEYKEGDRFADIVGPLGKPSEFATMTAEELRKRSFVFIGGGVGIAPIYPQVKWLNDHGATADCIIGARTKDLLIFEKELAEVSNLYVTSDDGSTGRKGLVTDVLRQLVASGKQYDEAVAIGPMIMMKFATKTCEELGIRCTVSLNSIMVDGTGMCGACRVSIGGKTKFTCIDGPEFLGKDVDFDEAMKRQAMYNNVVTRKQLQAEEKAEGHKCHIGGISEESFDKKKRVPVPEQKPEIIPDFIARVAQGDFAGAAGVISCESALPAVCGRVCPQETQCEGACVMGKKFEPIAIGKLERFVGDYAIEHDLHFSSQSIPNGHKVAIIGSGPSGLTCAKDLLSMGYDVTIFEALHELGGVLMYGIPSFRLPKDTVVKKEVESVRKLGAKFEKDVVVGRTITIDELMKREGFEAVFVGSGAGFPMMLNVPGENLCGVVSANEFLTRNNLLFAYKEGYQTPNYVGKKVAVVGGGNVAMDAARTALRLGAEVHIVYRRSEAELPARVEEVHHAKEEGVIFDLLTAPVEVLGDENGWVKGFKCVKCELGEPDASGRRSPVPIKDSEFVLDVDMIIMALGTSPNPLIGSTTRNLDLNKKGCIVADEVGTTSRPGIFAGGDAVSGAATVILAMGAGKKSAKAIDEYIKSLH